MRCCLRLAVGEPAHAAAGRARLISRYGASSWRSAASYWNGNVSAYSSTKKSKGLMTVMSATSRTSTASSVIGSGKTTRADQLPNGSCCQYRRCVGRARSSSAVVVDRRARVRRREEPNHVRREADRAVVLVTCRVLERDVNGHQSRQHTLARAVSCDLRSCQRELRRRGFRIVRIALTRTWRVAGTSLLG